MNVPETQPPQKTNQDFPVVGIGASDGGLDAFKKILSAIQPDSGMTYIIFQHLSPDYPNNLSELLALSTHIPVHEIINTIHISPNHIYIIPENNNLIALDGVLKLQQRTRSDKKNKSIDIFFESIAEVHKSFAIGVILSGTAFDGTIGLKKIKEFGGATIAQDPETAIFKGMPQSAIDANAIDFILPPENIAFQLVAIRKSYIANHAYSEEEHIHGDEEVLNQILNLIFLRTGNDFRHYRQPAIRRRIAHRMVILKKENMQDYYNLLRNDKTEQDLLFNDFLIPVTYFFRDENFFETLPKLVFPHLIENIVNNNLRIWIAGCATGEEAYSMAIYLHEYLLENNLKDIRVQIFASDISEKCIAKARTALYSPQDLQLVSKTRLNSYFTKRDGHYHINKVIRDMCIFAVHNFIKNPPFARIDLVSCRNVLLYFDSFLQDKALSSFHYSLKENGYLLLGKSETANNALFESADQNEKIYLRKFTPGNFVPKPFKPAYINARQKIVNYKLKSVPEPNVEANLSLKISDQERIKELEKELNQMRETIKRVTEEQQTVFKELQTITEELLSSGEELQAMNEELETSTEELQSNNEELMCVNDELLDRQEQLISTRNYSESIVKTIREPLLIIDKDFMVKSANPAFYKYFQTTEAETEGHSFFEIGDCQWDIPEFKELIFKMSGEKNAIEDYKVDTLCTGLGKKTMMVNARKILNTKPEGMILLALEDITDLVTTNQLLKVKNTELEKYNEQLETFTSAASHDLQEPLRKINMFCKRIFDSEKGLSESGKHNLERVFFSVNNMSQLVTDLINYSRINFIEKEFKKTDLNLLLKKTIGDMKEVIAEKNVIITIDSFPQLSVIPYQIQQLFTNLISNSIKYTKENVVPEIKIETTQPSYEEIVEIGGDPEINYIKICVSDNGIGFGKNYETKIFDPFYRLHSADQYNGSGLGLTLVKKIVDNHEGFIKASSKIGHGTIMTIYLPLN